MKTKAFYISIVAVLLSLTVVKAQLGSHIGFNVGPSISNVYGSDGADNLRAHAGYAVGFTYQYAFSTMFALHTGVLWENKGAMSRVTLDPLGFDSKANINFNYVAIPVLFRVHLMPDNRLRPFINAGPYVSFLANQTTVTRTENDRGDVDVDRTTNTSDYRTVDAGLSGGAGLDYLITDRVHFDFEVRDNLGLVSATESGERLNHNSVNFLVGMLFSIP